MAMEIKEYDGFKPDAPKKKETKTKPIKKPEPIKPVKK